MPRHPLHSMIGPRQLLADVRNAVPWLLPAPKDLSTIDGSLADKAAAPLGWWDILSSARQLQLSKDPNAQEFVDYFTLCLCAHHCTVASYVPTDVDTKIRRHLWHYASSPGIIERMCSVLQHAIHWDRRTVQARTLDCQQHGTISGLDGEWLSVAIPAMCSAARHGMQALAEELWQWIDGEISRQASAMLQCIASQDPIRMLKAAAILTHNAGDIDQGINSSPVVPALQERIDSIKRLAHDRPDVRNGMFDLAARIYREIMAREHHRHYPLRSITVLRSHPDYALPLVPFLDDWGATLATHPQLNHEEQLEILGGLIHACDVLANQRAYHRAISAFLRHHADPDMLHYLPPGLMQRCKAGDLRQHINMDRDAFEAQISSELYELVPELNPERVQYYLKD